MAYGIEVQTVRDRLKKGSTLKEALTKPTASAPHIDHLGNVYNSFSEMCREYGIKPKSGFSRTGRGWNTEDTLTVDISVRDALLVNMFGTRFASWEEAEDHYCLSRIALLGRHEKGIDLDVPGMGSKPHKDHIGNEYANISEMAKHHNMGINLVHGRLSRDWSVDRALTQPVRLVGPNQTKVCVDHLGKRFESLSERARAYGLHPSVIRARLKSGYTLEEALTKPVKQCINKSIRIQHRVEAKRKAVENAGKVALEMSNVGKTNNPRNMRECVDHLGKVYQNKMKRAAAYELSASMIDWRLRHGYTLEEALTKPKYWGKT
jgi:hypothetical protein